MIDFNSIFDNEKARSVGHWHVIQWIPDIVAGEALNIGVVFEDNLGNRCVEVLDYFERIGKFLGEGFVYQAKLTCDIVREVALTMPLDMKISEQINIVKRGFTQGDNPADIVTLLFNKVVSLNNKIVEKRKGKNFASIPRDRLYNKMQNKLKSDLELDFSLYVPNNPYEKLNNNGHKLYLPFRSNDKVASLASASYSDIQHIKCNLYDAQRDVNTALKSLDRYNNGSIFVLTPSNDLDITKKNAIENEIEELKWHFNKVNIKLITDNNEKKLSNQIVEWCLCA